MWSENRQIPEAETAHSDVLQKKVCSKIKRIPQKATEDGHVVEFRIQ